MTEIAITGLDRVIAKLGRVATLDILEAPMERSLLKIEEKMKTYPPPPTSGQWAANTTPRQKRAFFALLRAGRIKGTRSGTLGRRWTHAITKTNDGMEGRVGNNVPYGPWVQSQRFQARFHQGRWPTDEQVMQELRPGIVRDFEETIRKEIGK